MASSPRLLVGCDILHDRLVSFTLLLTFLHNVHTITFRFFLTLDIFKFVNAFFVFIKKLYVIYFSVSSSFVRIMSLFF